MANLLAWNIIVKMVTPCVIIFIYNNILVFRTWQNYYPGILEGKRKASHLTLFSLGAPFTYPMLSVPQVSMQWEEWELFLC